MCTILTSSLCQEVVGRDVWFPSEITSVAHLGHMYHRRCISVYFQQAWTVCGGCLFHWAPDEKAPRGFLTTAGMVPNKHTQQHMREPGSYCPINPASKPYCLICVCVCEPFFTFRLFRWSTLLYLYPHTDTFGLNPQNSMC